MGSLASMSDGSAGRCQISPRLGLTGAALTRHDNPEVLASLTGVAGDEVEDGAVAVGAVAHDLDKAELSWDGELMTGGSERHND